MDRNLNERESAFIDELVALERKHGLWLSHEDGQGAFIVTDDKEQANNIENWQRAAFAASTETA